MPAFYSPQANGLKLRRKRPRFPPAGTNLARPEQSSNRNRCLQAPGFATLAEAQTAAEPIKEQLKIKDVWIFKR